MVKSDVSDANDFIIQTGTYDIPAQTKLVSRFPLKIPKAAVGSVGSVIWLYFGIIFNAIQNTASER